MPTFLFEIPGPPSANHLFVNNPRTRGRFPSHEYKEWQKMALLMLEENKAKSRKELSSLKKKTKWEAIYYFYFPENKINRCDLDNFIKPVNDILVKSLGIDDRYLVKMYAVKEETEKPLFHVYGYIQWPAENKAPGVAYWKWIGIKDPE